MDSSGGGEEGIDTLILGSEELTDLKCQPCHEDGNIRESVGMCVDCQDYLCKKCFDCHTLPKPSRDHQLLDKQQVLQSPMTQQEKCTERCTKHKGKVIKYYCTGHCKLACSICLNLDHRACEGVHYIPDVAKDLANNEEYKQAETLLNSVFTTLKEVSDDGQSITPKVEKSCDEEVEKLEEFRQRLNEALDEVKTKLVEKAKAIKMTATDKIETITAKYHETLEELETTLKEIATLQRTRRHCDLYTLLMKTNEKLKSSDQKEMKADLGQVWQTSQIQFTPNLEILDMLQNPESVGKMSGVGIGTLVGAENVRYVKMKTETDAKRCCITGSVILLDNTFVVVDQTNSSIKSVDVNLGNITAKLKLSSEPWDITTIRNKQVAVTLPDEKKVAFVTASTTMTVDRTLDVQGACRGINYNNGRLAVSFRNPDKVQVLNLQGTVLQNIATDQQGQAIFNSPDYLTFGQDNTTLYVSNNGSNNVLCVKTDGTVVATYKDKELDRPRKAVIDSSGNILVCTSGSNTIHKITPDCKKIRVLLDRPGGWALPNSISYSVAENQLYVGMNANTVKVYKGILGRE